MPTLVLADDHSLFVDALESVLSQQEFTVLGVALSLATLHEAVAAHQPDLCVVDRHFADGDSVDTLEHLVHASPCTGVLVLTADRDQAGMVRAMQAGAVGYVHKTRGLPVLINAIRRAARGEVVVDLPAMPAKPPRTITDVSRLAAYLTARERQCLALLVEGLGTTAMAYRLGVSATTVRSHVQALLTKLGAHSRLEAASLAVRHSLVEPAEPVAEAEA
jgi:DNA-binding NarL/FixJ family response regulator